MTIETAFVCPYPDCVHQFSADESQLDKRGHLQGECPSCQRLAAFRTPEALDIIEREFQKKVRSDSLKGGPDRAPDYIANRSVVVEDVRSLWNVGSMFRTSDGAGFEHMHLCGITGAPPRKEIAKVSLGAEHTVSWEYFKNPIEAVRHLRDSGVYILGLEKTAESVPLSQHLADAALGTPMSMIVGNEVSGLSPQMLALCDVVCHLPMRGMKESLNVAVAYGIASYAVAAYFDS